MNKQILMSQTLLVAGAAFMLFVGTGCRSTGVIGRDTHISVTPTQAGGMPVPATEILTSLKTSVRSKASDSGSQAVADGVAQIVTDFLVANGVVVDNSDPDMIVGLTSSKTLFDQSGNFYVFDGKVLASAHLPDTTRVVATKTLTARGKRQLDEAPADKALVDALSPLVTQWLEESLKPGRLPIAVRNIIIHRRTFINRDDPKYIATFVSQVSQIPGIMECSVREQDTTERRYTFRIVYKPENFSGGLLNTLILKCPKLDLAHP